MSIKSLVDSLRRIGAGVEFEVPRSRSFTVDVRKVDGEEKFILGLSKDVSVQVLDCVPSDRHMLLLIKEGVGRHQVKHRFIMGHDERHFFAAPVPGAPVNVAKAKEALKPAEVVEAQRGASRRKNLNRRKNESFVRQGEWFFIPRPDINPPANLIIRKEPISRGGGSKPHMVDEVFRMGGESILVSNEYPDGLTIEEHKNLIKRDPDKVHLTWRHAKRDATVYARGRVRHPDHSTIILDGWHLVVMNTEHRSISGGHLRFID